jgi:hypothetical protein
MSTIGIAERVFGMTEAQRTIKANERQIVAREDSESENLDGEPKGKEQFHPSIFFLAMALQRFDS